MIHLVFMEKLTAKDATLLDIRNLLNPDNIIDEEKAKSAILKHGNFLEFVDTNGVTENSTILDEENNLTHHSLQHYA
jgi:hypothetical protein